MKPVWDTALCSSLWRGSLGLLKKHHCHPAVGRDVCSNNISTALHYCFNYIILVLIEAIIENMMCPWHWMWVVLALKNQSRDRDQTTARGNCFANCTSAWTCDGEGVFHGPFTGRQMHFWKSLMFFESVIFCSNQLQYISPLCLGTNSFCLCAWWCMSSKYTLFSF